MPWLQRAESWAAANPSRGGRGEYRVSLLTRDAKLSQLLHLAGADEDLQREERGVAQRQDGGMQRLQYWRSSCQQTCYFMIDLQASTVQTKCKEDIRCRNSVAPYWVSVAFQPRSLDIIGRIQDGNAHILIFVLYRACGK